MKNLSSINENELDGALNAFFLNTYSHTEDERLARFILDQEYDAVMTEKNRKKLLRKLSGRRGGLFLLLALIGLVATVVLSVYFSVTDKKGETHFPVTTQPNNGTPGSENVAKGIQIAETPGKEHDQKMTTPAIMTSTSVVNNGEVITVTDTIRPVEAETGKRKEPRRNYVQSDAEVVENKKKLLPYFDEAGLAYFQAAKDDLLLKLLKLDNQFYVRIDPGATMYKNREILVSPFVMSNFPVTNLHYKVFLADLFRQGKMNELEKCLPKEEVWNEYACGNLAEYYFRSESYNHFPVVNIGMEAMLMFCKWMEEEANKALAGSKRPPAIAPNVAGKKTEVIVRLPYDYEWIYAADASYAIIPDCGGYNTIYDPSEGLVNASFFKRTSQLSKQAKKKLNRIDQLNDLNRFGMTENEMMGIFKEARSFKVKKAGQADPFSQEKVENCSLAGHVVELINTKDGGTTLRGCCWKDKGEYLKMANDYKKFGASPFVGFRITFVTKNGTYKEPFW